MGIDIYLTWEGMTEEDKEAQVTGFDITCGRFGYLREAYHGEPYATHTMFPETWASPEATHTYFANDLMPRLPKALAECYERYESDPQLCLLAMKSWIEFVQLMYDKENATHQPCTVHNSY